MLSLHFDHQINTNGSELDNLFYYHVSKMSSWWEIFMYCRKLILPEPEGIQVFEAIRNLQTDVYE